MRVRAEATCQREYDDAAESRAAFDVPPRPEEWLLEDLRIALKQIPEELRRDTPSPLPGRASSGPHQHVTGSSADDDQVARPPRERNLARAPGLTERTFKGGGSLLDPPCPAGRADPVSQHSVRARARRAFRLRDRVQPPGARVPRRKLDRAGAPALSGRTHSDHDEARESLAEADGFGARPAPFPRRVSAPLAPSVRAGLLKRSSGVLKNAHVFAQLTVLLAWVSVAAMAWNPE